MDVLAGDLLREGAWLSINHPALPDDERCMGCGWNHVDPATISQFQGIEVPNGTGADDVLAGWRCWAGLLNRGHRLVAVGGSDEHTPDEQTDRQIGQPTTMVYADELSERALVEGLRPGRVYVRTRGVDGPEIDVPRHARGSLLIWAGLPRQAKTLESSTRRAPGQKVQWVKNGMVERVDTIPEDGRCTATVMGESGSWFSAILSDDSGPTVFTNAVFID